MASFLRKSALLKKICRVNHQTFSFFATDFRHNLWNCTHRDLTQTRLLTCEYFRHLASLAHKYELNEENQKKVDGLSAGTIDDALSIIDTAAKHTGRVSRKDVEAVFEKIQHLGSASTIQSLYMIRCCGSLMRDDLPSRRIELVNKIWGSIQQLEIPVDASHYNSLLKVYLENGYKFSPTDFLTAMENKSVIPNRVTYQRLIEKYCNDGDLSGTSVILEFMKEKSIAVNEAVFNSLIKGHCNADDFEGARHMFEVMRKSQLNPSAETYTIMACCFAEKGDIENIKTTLKEAQFNELYVSDRNYLQIIYSLAISGHAHFIDEFLLEAVNVKECREDCVNTVLDLLNQGLHEAAYKIILKLVESFSYNNGLSLFMERLVQTGQPMGKVCAYCRGIRNKGYDKYIFSVAAKAALEDQNIDGTIELYKAMQKEGVPVRCHYFWPIFTIHIQQGNLAGIWTTLKVMYQLGIPADFDTYIDFIFPGISTSDPKLIIDKVKQIGQSEITVIDPLLQHYCNLGDLKNASYLISNYPVRMNCKRFLKTLASQYNPSSEDDLLLIQILTCLSENSGQRKEPDAQRDLYGLFFIYLSEENKLSTNLLKVAYAKGLRLFQSTAANICEKLKHKSPELVHLVKKLEDSVRFPVMNEPEENFVNPREMNLEDLEKHLLVLKQHGASTRAVLRHLLTIHCKKKNLERVIEIKAELDDQGFVFSPASYALLIQLFVSFNNIEEASKYKKLLVQEYPDFQLDTVKASEYMVLLIKCNKVKEALEVLKKDCSELSFPGNSDILFRSIKKLLNAAADSGNVELTNTLYNFFVPQLNVSNPKSMFLEALVKVHLVSNDLDKAIEEYKRCILTYHIFPGRSSLFRKCIEKDDSVRLQRVVDLTTIYGGKTSALHELALTFIETGHISQAHKVIQTLGGKADLGHLDDMCSRLFKQNKILELEQLINVTKDLFHIDRDKLYYYLLQLYAQNNDYQKALELWNSLQEENVQPSIKTMSFVADILKKNEQPVPFVVPNEDCTLRSDESIVIEPKEFLQHPKEKLLECMDRENISEVIELLKRMKKGDVRSLPLSFMTSIIDFMIAKNCLKDLSPIVQVMSYSLEKAHDIFKPVLEKYADAGNVDVLKLLYEFLPDFTQKSVNFNYYFHRAYIISGKQEELIEELGDNMNKKKKLFSFAGFQELLATCPHLEEEGAKLADRYIQEENFDIPTKVLWVHSFVTEQYEKADQIYKQHPTVFMSMDYLAAQIIKNIRNTKNESMGQKFIELSNQYNVKKRIKDRAYSCLLDVLVDQVKLEEAVELITEAEKLDIPLNRFSKTTLINLHNLLKERNKVVPFQVPEDDGSSSSSDSE